MITIIHGDDIVSSRKHFISEKEKVQNSIIFDGGKVTITDLIQAFEGSLFGSENSIFVEGLLERKRKEQSEIIIYIKDQKSGNFFIWEDKELSKAQLSVLHLRMLISIKLFRQLRNYHQ